MSTVRTHAWMLLHCPLARDLNQTPLSFHLLIMRTVSKLTGGSYELMCTQLGSLPRVWVPTLFSSTLRRSFTSIQHADASIHTKGKLTRSYPSGKNTSKKCLVFCNLSHYSLKSYNMTSKHIKLLKLQTLK